MAGDVAMFFFSMIENIGFAMTQRSGHVASTQMVKQTLIIYSLAVEWTTE